MKRLAAVICLTCLLGCSRPPPYLQPVEAETTARFASWRSKNSDALTAKEWALFDLATDELKLKIMMEGKTSGSQAIDEALRTKIDGMKLGEVMLTGLQTRQQRLRAAKTLLAEALVINSRLKLKPGEADKAQALAEKVQEQSDRLKKMEATLTEAEADLHELELKFK